MKTEVSISKQSLPATAGELQDFILLSREKVSAFKVALASATRQGLSNDHASLLAEGQIVGEQLLHAEARLGELLSKSKGYHATTFKKGGEKSLPDNIDKHTSHLAQKLFRNQGVIERAVEIAKESGTIPTRRDVLLAIRESSRELHLKTLATRPWPSGKYRIIYADPPWKYGDERKGLTSATGATDHYPTKSTEEICALDVPGITLSSAVLWLWCPAPLLPDGLRVIDAWGFTYKTNFVWSKGGSALGNYNTASHEHLLLGTIGSCLPDINERAHSVQSIKRSEHSRKPEEFRQIIDRLYPHGPRIELFSRGVIKKTWATWGNE